MVDVFGVEEAGCFGPQKWGRRLEILDCFGQSRLGLETTFGWSLLCVCDDLDSTKLNCRIFLLAHVSRFCVIAYDE